MSKKNKISASHILVMHQESQNSRSELTSEEAKKKIDDIYKEIKSGSIKFADAAVKHSNCPSGPIGRNVLLNKSSFFNSFTNFCFNQQY